MAQNLVINSVTYNAVDSLSIPKSGGGNAVFPDTSDATAVAGDIASGKTAYVGGLKVTGTATGGGGGVETCTLTTSVDKAPGSVHGTIYAYSGNTLITITSKGTYSINKNSLIYINGASLFASASGMAKLYYSQTHAVYNVTSDVATYEFAS